MTRARLNGIEIDYQASGAGPALLLSHGYSATRRMWDGQHAILGDGHRVISWSMRGHGETESPADPAQYSADLTVADMRALLGHLGVEHAVIGGLSLGGYVSLAFYLAHPEMVRALVICDSGPATAALTRARPGTSAPRSARSRWRRAASRRSAGAARCGSRRAFTARPRAWPTPRAACWPRRARA